MSNLGIDPAPTVAPPFPPNENCETNWFYLESTGNCHYIDHYHRAGWDGAQANCVGLGGNLVSINSPEAQLELRVHLNDPDVIGKSNLNYI